MSRAERGVGQESEQVWCTREGQLLEGQRRSSCHELRVQGRRGQLGQQTQRGQRALVPRMWVVLVSCVVGIYATSLVYRAVVDGGWKTGIIGAIILSVSVYLTANPLAASMWSHRQKRSARLHARDEARKIIG